MVARHDDRNGVGAVCLTDRLRRASEFLRDLTVSAHTAVRDGDHAVVQLCLKRRDRTCQRQNKGVSFAKELLGQLPRGFAEFSTCTFRWSVGKPDQCEMAVLNDKGNGSEGAIDCAALHD